jgi:hypothetical protein
MAPTSLPVRLEGAGLVIRGLGSHDRRLLRRAVAGQTRMGP